MRHLLDAVLTIGSDLDLPAMLLRIVETAVSLVDARYGALRVLDEEKTAVAELITVGVDPGTHTAVGDAPKGHGIFVPVTVRGEVFGNLYLTDKTTAEAFTDIDEELVAALAAAAGVAIENARLHTLVQDVVVLEDRERIARDLHDTVIQRLFATGLSLQGTANLIKDPQVARRLELAVEDLDITVRQIRTAIFGLEASRAGRSGARDRILSVIAEVARVLGFEPRVLFDGPIDSVVADDVATELVATLREALSNVARHAGATEARVVVTAANDLLLRVSDDGGGSHSDTPTGGRGLANMRARAEKLGGTVAIGPGPHGGTVVEWRVPLGP
jgi:signal transduction histidine kinase